MRSSAPPDGGRALLARALGLWWALAAGAAFVALFAFPVYKAVLIGMVPVFAGVGLALALRFVPIAWLAPADRLLNESRPASWLATIVVLGLALRLVVVALPPLPVSDHATYLSYGRSLASGAGLGNLILWPPGPPATVAVGILLLGDGRHALAAFHCAIGLATAVVLYLGLRRHSEPAARWASLVAAAWPSIVLWNSTVGHETLATLLFVLLFLLVLRLPAGLRTGWATTIALGAIAGVMALVRPTALAMPLLAFLALGLAGTPWIAAAVRALVVGAVMALVIAPWTLRNHERFGEFCLISANAGNVLLSSNHPASDGIYHTLPPLPQYKPCERDRVRGREARAAIAADPVRFLALSAKRLAFMWGTDTSGLDFVLGEPPRGGDAAKKGLSALLQVPCALLVTAWALAAWKARGHLSRAPGWWLPALWIALLWLVHAIVEPLSRHHIPLIPLIAAIVMPPYWEWVRRVAPPGESPSRKPGP